MPSVGIADICGLLASAFTGAQVTQQVRDVDPAGGSILAGPTALWAVLVFRHRRNPVIGALACLRNGSR